MFEMKLRVPISYLFCAGITLTPKALTASPVLAVSSFVDFNIPNGSLATAQVLCNGPANCTGSAGVPGTALQMNYSSYGTAAFGILNSYDSATIVAGTQVSPPGPNDHAVVRTTDTFEDAYTFSGGPPGTTGTTAFTYTVTGTATVSSSTNLTAVVIVIIDPSTGAEYDFTPDASGKAVSPTIPITFGVPIDLRTSFVPLVNIFDFTPSSFGVLDYSHTAILTGIRVDGASGTPIPFTVSSASGTGYGPAGVVPEPSSWLLLATGAGISFFFRRRLLRLG